MPKILDPIKRKEKEIKDAIKKEMKEKKKLNKIKPEKSQFKIEKGPFIVDFK